MATRCSICRHPRVGEIDVSLEASWTLRAIEERFKETSRSSLGRHNQHRRALVVMDREDLDKALAAFEDRLMELVALVVEKNGGDAELARLEMAWARSAREGEGP